MGSQKLARQRSQRVPYASEHSHKLGVGGVQLISVPR